MGLLDALFAGNQGAGGLLSYLQAPAYPSPLNQPQDVQQPQYDAMGNYTGITPQSSASPFPSLPDANYAQFAPKPNTTAFSPFNQGASPVPGFAMPQAPQMAQQPQAPQLPPAQTIAPAPQLAAAPTAAPIQLPSTDISAQSRQQQPDQPLPPAFGGGSYLDRLNNGGGLISSLFGDSGQQQNLSAQYHALRTALEANGETKQAAASKAMIAVSNPEAAKTIIPELFTAKTELKMVKDEFGAEHPYSWNPREQTFVPVGGASNSTSAPSAGIQEMTDKLTAMRSKGASQEQLLNEVPASYRGYVKSLIAGEALPQNIGRSQLRGPLMTLAHAVDGHFDESLIPQRMTYARGIGDTKSIGAPGGQRQAISTATGHFADLADALVAQNNVNGGPLAGLPGSGPLATGYNAIANSSSKNSQNSAKILQEADSTAGEMGKLYYGSSGGGVHEREATKSRYSPNLPPLKAAGALEATRDLLLEKIKANEAARDQAFGPNAKERIDFMDEGVKKNLARVESAIAKLKGSEPQAVPGLPSGWSVKVSH